jgi:hypothetical protein
MRPAFSYSVTVSVSDAVSDKVRTERGRAEEKRGKGEEEQG